MARKKLIVSIPAYNEAETIYKAVSNVLKVVKTLPFDGSVLVLDDGSKDATAANAKKAGAIVVSHPLNYGLAEAFRSEIEQCLRLKADYIIHFDADLQYVPEEIPRLIQELDRGADLVLGSRFRGKIESMPIIKRLGNIAFSNVISGIARQNISDGQTGFRAFTRELASSIRITSTHTYTQEQILRASMHKFKIVEVPVTFRKRVSGESRLISNPFDYAFKAWINILRIYRDYEPLRFFGAVGTLIFSVGVALGLWLISIYIRTGAVGKIPTLMLTVLILSLGFQLIIFGFIADMLKKDG